MRDDARLLLRGERRADEQPQQPLGELARHAALSRRGAHTHDHLALALVVARRLAGRALDVRHLFAQRLALGYELDELAVEIVHSLAEILQRHGVARHGRGPPQVPTPFYRGAAGGASGGARQRKQVVPLNRLAAAARCGC